METDAIPPEVHEQIDSADLVVGLIAEFDSQTVAQFYNALRALPDPLRIAVVDNDPAAAKTPPNPNAGETESTEAAKNQATVFHLASPWTKPEGNAPIMLRMAAAYQSVFELADKLQARGCCVIASGLERIAQGWAWQLAQPLFQDNIDLVLPHYARRKFEGLLNNGIIAPLLRTLYGKRINNPMGPDFAVSQRLLQRVLAATGGENSNGKRRHPLASLTSTALCENLQVVEVHCGPRIYPPVDWTGLSSILADVLGPIFLDMERKAPCWQRTRVAASVRAIGEPVVLDKDAGVIETARMVESFQLGNRELQEIWGLVLPPSSLFELRKLARLPLEQFHMPDELWVRIVYDFALAHRLRTISRDHLLRSMTPLYLAWVASYAQDLKASGVTSAERRLERLSLAYEAGKSYLVSRWRWPDRFNP